MAIVKPDLSQQWASDGDKIAPSGAKIQAGWGPEIPPYQWENFIQNRQDEMLAYLNERGIPEWDNRTNYVGSGKSYVQGSDGKVYKSVAASGPSSVVSNPTTDVTDTYWTVAFADVGAFLTQAAGDARYLQISNNLSDLSNPTVARSNLGLGTAATANLTTSNADGTAGRVLRVGDGGWMGQGSGQASPYGYPTSIGDATNQTKVIRSNADDNGVFALASGIHFAVNDTWGRLRVQYDLPAAWVQGGRADTGTGWTSQVVLSNNLLQTTGSSTYFPMSQAATTNQLATKANIASPAFTGTPTAPTPSAGTRSTAIATMQNFADEFASSLAANGYQRLPSGLIIQWGTITGVTTSDVVITFPIAFPTNTVHVGIQARGDVNSPASGKEVDAPPMTIRTTSFTLNGGPDTGHYGGVFLWFAIGY